MINATQTERKAISRLKAAGFTIGLVAFFSLIFLQSHPRQLGNAGRDWPYFAMGVALTFFASADIKSGVTGLVGPTFNRSEDPLGYWTFVSVMTIAAAGVTFGSLGGILGLWRF